LGTNGNHLINQSKYWPTISLSLFYDTVFISDFTELNTRMAGE
jgi:hypothetical protein